MKKCLILAIVLLLNSTLFSPEPAAAQRRQGFREAEFTLAITVSENDLYKINLNPLTRIALSAFANGQEYYFFPSQFIASEKGALSGKCLNLAVIGIPDWDDAFDIVQDLTANRIETEKGYGRGIDCQLINRQRRYSAEVLG